MTAMQHRELGPPIPILLVLATMPLCSIRKFEGFAVRLYPDAKALLNEPSLPDIGWTFIDYYMPGMNGLEFLAGGHGVRYLNSRSPIPEKPLKH